MSILSAILMFGASLGATISSTNEIIVSEVKTSLKWERTVVMKDEDGKIVSDKGVVTSLAESRAVDEAARRVGEVSEAATNAIAGSIGELRAAKSSAATKSHMFAIIVPPEMDTEVPLGYVVKTTTSGSVDTQWVWYSHSLAVAPNRFVEYSTYGRATTNKVTWVDWNTSESVTVNGKTWNGCKKCVVTRPSWAVGLSAVDGPNDRWGGPTGMDFGDIILMMDGEPLYTGYITNKTDSADVIFFSNGFYMGKYEEDTDEN